MPDYYHDVKKIYHDVKKNYHDVKTAASQVGVLNVTCGYRTLLRLYSGEQHKKAGATIGPGFFKWAGARPALTIFSRVTGSGFFGKRRFYR